MKVHRENLMMALNLAIIDQRKAEKAHGFTGDSAFVAGITELLKAVQRGENIEFFPRTS